MSRKQRDLNRRLIDFVLLSDCEQVSRLLKEGADPNAAHEEHHQTGLMFAAETGNDPIIVTLLDAGADINASDDFGNTALFTASFGGHVDTVRMLLARGAEVNKRNLDGRTALYVAATRLDPDAITVLISAGADTDIKDVGGESICETLTQLGRSDLLHV